MSQRPPQVLILGAGPAGLGAGYELSLHHIPCTLIEKNSSVGGLARTLTYQGFRFDVGPHRFFTKNETVNHYWHQVLGPDFIRVPRLTRIYYRDRFFHYPLKPLDALLGLGIGTSLAALASYFHALLFLRGREAKTFEEWIVARFGRRLYEAFFKTYTEKVWGVPCSQIGAEWAAQRIRGLSLWQALSNALLGNRGKIRTLTDSFHYPRYGAGMLYDQMAVAIRAAGNPIYLDTEVEAIVRLGDCLSGVRCRGGLEVDLRPHHQVLSSIPLTELVTRLTPAAPDEVLEAAARMRYRDHITVNLLYQGDNPFPDNWIYIHSDRVQMARLTNYANFSSDMVPAPGCHGLGVEYFCFREDPLWQHDDEVLIQLAIEELTLMDLIRPDNVRGGFVIREPNSYPAYYAGFQPYFQNLKGYVRSLTNLQMIGRGGMFRYNNQDHALLSGLLAVRNLLGEHHDIWEINAEDEYLEEPSAKGAQS